MTGSGEGRFQMIEADEDAMDKILEATGFSAESRQLTRKLRPSLEYSREGTKFNVKYIDGEHVATQSFELDKEFEQTMIDGRKSKVLFTSDGTKMTETETCDGKTVIKERVTEGDKMFITIRYGDMVAKRVYKRV